MGTRTPSPTIDASSVPLHTTCLVPYAVSPCLKDSRLGRDKVSELPTLRSESAVTSCEPLVRTVRWLK